jgi:hypothetical protein
MVGTVNKDPRCCVVCVVVPPIIEANDVRLISKLVSKRNLVQLTSGAHSIVICSYRPRPVKLILMYFHWCQWDHRALAQGRAGAASPLNEPVLRVLLHTTALWIPRQSILACSQHTLRTLDTTLGSSWIRTQAIPAELDGLGAYIGQPKLLGTQMSLILRSM